MFFLFTQMSFGSQISPFHTFLFFDNDTQGMMVWRILLYL